MVEIDQCRDGLPIFLDKEKKEIVYKDNHVSCQDIRDAYESGFDRVQLGPDLYFRNYNGICEFGCLVMQEERVQQLIKIVWKLLKT